MFENVEKCNKATYKCKEYYFCANVFYQIQFSFHDVTGGREEEGSRGEGKREQDRRLSFLLYP